MILSFRVFFPLQQAEFGSQDDDANELFGRLVFTGWFSNLGRRVVSVAVFDVCVNE